MERAAEDDERPRRRRRAVLGACVDVPDALYGPQVNSPDRLGDVLAVAAV